MRINQNISAMNTYSRLTGANNSKSKSLEKLSSGLRINRAGDDAAGLAISEKMRGQVGGLKQAVRNAQDGISLIQTAEGALNETHSILGRMRDLAVQSSSDTNTDADRAEIQKEMDQLASEMTRISNTTEFNTQNLLSGTLQDTTFHIGANSGQHIKLSIGAMDAKSLGVAADKDIPSATVEGDVGSVKFGRDLGAGVVDGAVVSLNFTAEVEAVDEVKAAAATAGKSTFKINAANFADFKTAVTGANAGDATLTVTVDGTAKTIDLKALNTAANAGAGWTDFTEVATDINTALGGGATATVSAEGEIVITSATDGVDSKVALTGAGATLFTSPVEVDGKDEVLAVAEVKGESAYVALADGTKVDVDASATSFKVTKGDFAGLEITLAEGQTVADLLAADDTFTIKVETVKAVEGKDGEDAVAPAGIDVTKQDAADKAITIIDDATQKVSEERSKLGSVQNRLDHTINNLTATAENLSAAESRIRDVDMAEEMMEFTKNNILSQAATSMLAQANQMPQSVLQLLQ